jgi:hypothetical protein
MKKILLILVLMTSGIAGFSQNKSPFPERKQISAFLKSELEVVLDGKNPASGYNIMIKKAIQDYWKITPYKFISDADFQKMRTDSTKSFLVLVKQSFTKDKYEVYYGFVNLLLGGSAEDITLMTEFANVPLCYTNTDESEYDYKMGVIVQFIQNHVQLMNLTPNNKSLKNLKFYNKNIREIRKKTLLIAQTDLAAGLDTLTDFKALYPYDLKIVTHDEIEKAITSKAENTVFLHKVGPGQDNNYFGRSYQLIFGTDDNKLYYFDYHKVDDKKPDGFSKSDFFMIK